MKGKSGRPIYVWLHDGKVEIRNAEHLWSKDTYEVAELVKKETDNNASTACIGPAGEKLVRISCIMNDGRMGRAAARCGLGALMGSKRLKAVVVRGTLPVGYYDEQKLRESIKRIYNLYPIRKAADVIEGHIASLKKRLEIGGAPVKNWSRGTFESGYKLADECRKQSHCAVKVVPLTIWSRFSLRMEKDAWCMRHGDH